MVKKTYTVSQFNTDGSGSPENVEKIRRANGLSGNNIRNGQQIVIP